MEPLKVWQLFVLLCCAGCVAVKLSGACKTAFANLCNNNRRLWCKNWRHKLSYHLRQGGKVIWRNGILRSGRCPVKKKTMFPKRLRLLQCESSRLEWKLELARSSRTLFYINLNEALVRRRRRRKKNWWLLFRILLVCTYPSLDPLLCRIL